MTLTGNQDQRWIFCLKILIYFLFKVPGLVYKDQEEEDKERPRESLKMIKNAKKREKKQVRVKRVKVKRVKVKPDARRLRQQARRERQHERQVRKRARQVRKREAMSLRSEKKERAKQKGHKGRLVDQEVKRILMRAPLKARGHTKVDSLHVTVTVDFLKSRLSLSTFLLRQSTHCRRIQCKILR